MQSIKPNEDTMIDFLIYLGSIYPKEAAEFGWPHRHVDATAASWQKIARNWRKALSPNLDWVTELPAEGTTLLAAALSAHQASPEGEAMPNPVRLNNIAQQVLDDHRKQDAEADRVWQIEQDKARVSKGPSETILRCKAVLMCKGIMTIDPENPYAPIDDDRIADLQRWADKANENRQHDQEPLTLAGPRGPMKRDLLSSMTGEVSP